MGIYVGINGTPKEVAAVYVGVNGTPKECSDIYVGVNGTPKPCYSGVKPGETIFTSSTNFTVPKGVKKIDCFCVGGGGSGGDRKSGSIEISSTWHDTIYTWFSQSFSLPCSKCHKETSISSSTVFSTSQPSERVISCSTCGTAKVWLPYVNNGVYVSGFFSYTYDYWYEGGSGGGGGYTATALGADVSPGNIISVAVGDIAGTSSIGNICSADGGLQREYAGGDGGSGGGGAGGFSSGGGAGGSDGGNGSDSSSFNGFSTFTYSGGKGQGTTTRYFGESTGTLYASGGDGSFYSAGTGSSVGANTGNGGNANSGAGASGIAIIRWGK